MCVCVCLYVVGHVYGCERLLAQVSCVVSVCACLCCVLCKADSSRVCLGAMCVDVCKYQCSSLSAQLSVVNE